MAGESAREVARRAREKAERLNKRAEQFEQGADGEAATAEVLTTLPPGWLSLHDVRWPGRRLANVDHVLIGPGGVFVIDSKNWTGRITLDGGHLRQNGYSREKAVAGAADAALAVSELISPYAAWVHPVLCFVGQDHLSGWCREVMVCSTANLVGMLTSRPGVLDPGAGQLPARSAGERAAPYVGSAGRTVEGLHLSGPRVDVVEAASATASEQEQGTFAHPLPCRGRDAHRAGQRRAPARCGHRRRLGRTAHQEPRYAVVLGEPDLGAHSGQVSAEPKGRKERATARAQERKRAHESTTPVSAIDECATP